MGAGWSLLPEWSSPAEQLELTPEDVAVWHFVLDRDSPPEGALRQVLSEDERARADRFRFPIDRMRFMAARGLLRGVLGAYLRRPPSSLTFVYGDYGKPSLCDGGATDLRFNVSHSDRMALVAVCFGREVGIDIERVSPDLDVEAIGREVYSREELNMLRPLSDQERQMAFFIYWACKEAVIKAVGTGFSLAPRRFTVRPDEGRVVSEHSEAELWRVSALSVRPLDLVEGYAAALAVSGPVGELRLMQAPGSGAYRSFTAD
jgi:4'-phosphopantetheinyl transferase